MDTKYFKNNYGHQLGIIETDNNGNQRIYNNHRYYKGEYRQSIVYCNLLVTLLQN